MCGIGDSGTKHAVFALASHQEVQCGKSENNDRGNRARRREHE